MERMNFESMWERGRREVERHPNPETARLKAAIERIIAAPVGDPGTPPTTGVRIHQLERILTAEPQRAVDGTLRYLLTSGLAVELVTGFKRAHHDIDLVIMDPSDSRRWDILGTDNVTPGQYWAHMTFEPEFLEDTARSVATRRGRTSSPTVEVVNPGVILVQKVSDAWGRTPRTRDKDDADAIAKHWKQREDYSHDWDPIIRHALDALPGSQLQTSLLRLRKVLAAV